jgi:hypothetical protein
MPLKHGTYIQRFIDKFDYRIYYLTLSSMFSFAKYQNHSPTIDKLLKKVSISLAFITFIILLPFCSFAQYTIIGRVLNQADTKPVANASVFLSNTATGNKTAGNGTFTLENAKPGKYKLVISIVGFETYSETLIVGNSGINLHDITIFPKTIGLKEVTIRVDRNRDKYFNMFYDRFKREFLGRSDAASECKILNPQVLAFDYDAEINTLTVSSQGFLEIENDALGYKINYLLTNFRLNDYTNEVHYEGPVLFTEMTGTPAQVRHWLQNRRTAYEGSMMHFLRSVMNDRLEEEGFRAYQLAVYANPARPPDSIIEAKIKKFERPYKGATAQVQGSQNLVFPGSRIDSLPFWRRVAKLPKILQTLMHFPLNKGDIISSTHEPGIFAFGCDSDKLLIMYDKDHRFTQIKQLTDLNNLNYVLNKYNNKELTLVNFTIPYAFFDVNGWVTDPNSLAINGVWSLDRVAELLPVNYEAAQNTMVLADDALKNIENKIDAFAASHISEKVHLQLDRPWYGLGDTIWFKAYAVAGADHHLSTLSGVLYTELINEKDSVVKRLTLPLDSGISHGDFVLPYTYKSGTYRLRAYTRLMLNDSAKLYDQKLIIGGINPQADQTVAINTKHNVSLNNLQQKEHGNPDVQFFPEGGDLVNGLRCKVAVKAINREGLAENIQGIITDQDGNEAASFSTQHLGMGQFPLTPQPGKQYKAKIICADGSDFTANLPKAKDEGFTLTLNNAGDSIYVKVAANELFYKNNQNGAFYLIAQCGGKYYYTAAGKLASPIFAAGIDKRRFPAGIIQFTLFSQNGEPLNERIVFVQNNDQLKLALTSAKQSYAPMEKVKIDLDAKKEDDRTISGSFSVAVTNETKVPVDEGSEPTILTDLLLTSELKGTIENPNYYFINQDDKTRSDLDLLMLTQGYRRFDWKRLLAGSNPGTTSKPETALSLTGAIKTLSNKPIANGRVRLTSIKDHFSADTLSDINGNFKFTNLSFDDTTKVIINAQKTNGSKNVLISIKQPSYAAIGKTGHISYLNDSLREPVLAALKETYLAGQQSLKNVIQLNEVKIKSRRNEFFQPKYSENMQFSSNLNGPGNADQVVLGDKLTIGGGGRLSDILQSKIFGLTWINGIPHSTRATHIGEGGPMALIIEGIQVSMSELNDINPYDIYSIEVLTSITYLSMYGSNAPNGALIITMKHGADPVDLTKISVDGLITYKFKGFYKAREFYSPKYNSISTARVSDARKTIYWNPNIITGAKGKTSFEYFNAGSPGTYRVVIEGIDGDGNLGRQVLRYKVE